MKKQKKLEDGLNRLFSSSRITPPEPESTQIPEKSIHKQSKPKEDQTNKLKTELKVSIEKLPPAPPPSHLIPVPAKPSLPLPVSSDVEGDEEIDLDAAQAELDRLSNATPPADLEKIPQTKKSEKQAEDTIISPSEKSPPTPVKPDIPNKTTPQVKGIEPVQPETTKSLSDEQIVVFTLAKQFYGINISVVDGIIKMQSITVVPRAPHYIEGVTNLRGNVVPVIDLHKRLDVEANGKSQENRIIIVNLNGVVAGMIVDAVEAVTFVEKKDIDTISKTISSIDSQFIRAVAKVNDNLVILLDLENVLKGRKSSKGHY